MDILDERSENNTTANLLACQSPVAGDTYPEDVTFRFTSKQKT